MRAPLALAVAVALLAASPASAFELGIQDDPVLVRSPHVYAGRGAGDLLSLDRAYAAIGGLGVRAVRMNVPWSEVESESGALDWSLYDAAVDRARREGMLVQLTLTGPAPAFASGDGRVSYTRPDPAEFGAFAGAAARHFSGRVARYSIWNEPNWLTYLRPSRSAPQLYRALYRSAWAAIKAADPAAQVLIGEFAPMGRPEAATHPLAFLRRLTCSDRRWRPVKGCAPLYADGFAHHPYTLRWAPEFPGPGRDDVTTGSLWRLEHALDRLARRGALAQPSGRALDLFLTEWGYHADSVRIPEARRARFVGRGVQLLRRDARVRQLVWYQLAGPPAAATRIWDTALLDHTGKPRPTLRVLRDGMRIPARRLTAATDSG